MQRLSDEEVLHRDPNRKLSLLGVRTAGSLWVLGGFSRTLGGFSAESRRVLGATSAGSRRVLGGSRLFLGVYAEDS